MRNMKLEDLPDPSFGEIGKLVFERSYSRIKEDGTQETWAETVQRVVEGNTQFVDEKYIEPREKEKLFNLIYNFRALPAGRHLWATGVKNRQFISNCFVSEWSQDFSRHFTFTFARLMEGGGVGSSYSDEWIKGKYPPVSSEVELHLVCDEEHEDYNELEEYLSDSISSEWYGTLAVEDSRHGWVGALEWVIKAHFNGETDDPLVIDLSHIRPRGSKLKSFGGTASGPLYLAKLLINANLVLNDQIGKEPDWKLCLALDHEIAKAVVAGGTRRSSQLGSKSWKDPGIFEFINIKNADDGTTRYWTMNISVELDAEFWQTYYRGDERCGKILDAIAEGMIRDGEPGVLNLTSMSEGEVDRIFTTNPCVTGDTKVIRADTSEPVTFKELAEAGDDIPVFCEDSDGQIITRMMRNPRCTGKNKKVYRVTFSDGSSIKVTANHKFILTNGEVKRCDALEPGYAIKSMTAYTNKAGYWGVTPGSEEAAAAYNHRVASVEYVGREDVYNGTVDEFHELFIVCGEDETNNHKPLYRNILCKNCGELPLPQHGSCCLASVNLGKFVHDEVSMREAFRLMTRFLIRATWSDYTDEALEERVERDRRIGVGIFGFHDWLIKLGIRFTDFPNNYYAQGILADMADVVSETARQYAKQLRIPEPIKTRCIAPTGTTSQLCGASSGMQPIFYKYFLRRVRVASLGEEKLKKLAQFTDSGFVVEDDLCAANTKVVTFPCKAAVLDDAKDLDKVEDSTEITLEDYLAVQATLQRIWADNAISSTVTIDPEEVDKSRVKKALVSYGPQLKGMTIFPKLSKRPQQPIEKITEEQYNEYKVKLVDASFGECKGGVCGLDRVEL